ncbi:MAG: heavy-metal-associated domain-containing protein [Planctomycetaceae bacterium]|nr:heavy-metal-associated domain-containing protein [Planctomycetaceae bacterium]
MFVRTLSLFVLFASSSVAALAGQVEVTGVHLCCGACTTAVAKALSEVEGVSNVTSDRETKTIRYTAADDTAAAVGIEALATAGFHGTAKHDDKAADFPASGAKEGAKASRIKISNVHLCCAACVKAADAAVRKVDGVSNVTADRDASSLEITGDNVSVESVVAALNGAGFHATVEQ